MVVDDYAHHPTEIKATLAAAKNSGWKRVLALFQPHRYTRTQALIDDFGRSFHQADSVHVTDIYAASEAPIPGVNSQALVDKLVQQTLPQRGRTCETGIFEYACYRLRRTGLFSMDGIGRKS